MSLKDIPERLTKKIIVVVVIVHDAFLGDFGQAPKLLLISLVLLLRLLS